MVEFLLVCARMGGVQNGMHDKCIKQQVNKFTHDILSAFSTKPHLERGGPRMATDTRTTSYAITLYQESCDIGRFISHVKHLHVPNALSPLHDSDIYDDADVDRYQQRVKDKTVAPDEDVPEVGKLKKPHYHWCVSFGRQKKSAAQVLELIRDVAPTVRWAEPLGSFTGYLRYLIHLDDPEKFRYDVNDIQAFCGCDLSPLWRVTEQQSNGAMAEILAWCRQYGIYSWCDVVDIVMGIGSTDLIKAMQTNQYLIKSYCDSIYLKHSGKMPDNIDTEKVIALIRKGNSPTGELKVVA